MARNLLRRRMLPSDDVPSMLERFWNEPLTPRTLWGEMAVDDIKIDMVEEDGDLVVKASVPGLAREDLHADVQGDELRIWGERKEERAHDDEDVYIREHRYGRVERRMLLPRDVDASQAKARYEGGVLTLRMPIVDQPEHREIAIEAVEEG